MKTNFKRLFALVLTVCMLASLMVPVAFAEDEAVATPSVYAAETYKIRVKDLSNTDPANPTDAVDGKFVETDAEGVSTFKASYQVSKFESYYDTWGWKYYGASDGLSYYANRMYMARMGYKGWAALQIKVSDAGLYALNLKTDKTVDDETEVTPWTNLSSAWSGDVTAYIIPLAVAAESADLAVLMTDKYCVGTVNMAAGVDNVTFAKTRMEAGEYVVVYYAENNFSISEMSLLETAADAAQYELKDVVNYPIRLVDPTVAPADAVEPGSWFISKGAYARTNMEAVATEISDAYAAGTLNWKYLASNTASASNVVYRLDYNMMLRISKNELTALQIKVPASGNYSLTVSTDRTASYDSGLTHGNPTAANPGITAYLVNKADLTEEVTAENIASLAVEENCVGTVALAADATKGAFDRTYLKAGEYVLVITAASNYPYISEFSLVQRAYEVLPENEEEVIEDISYKFDLYNNERYAPVFTTPETGATNNRSFTALALTGLDGVYEAGEAFGDILLNDYNNGVINWKLYDKGTMSVLTFEAADTGLRIRNNANSGANQYAAFCLNVPATAMYTVNVVGAYNDADVNVYAYDADAEGDVASNMTDANLAGSIATSATTLTFSEVLTAGENIIVFEIVGTDKNETFKLNRIELSVNTDPSSISFDLSTNDAYIAAIKAASDNNITDLVWGSSADMNKIEYTDAEGAAATVYPYAVLGNMFKNGQIDWAIDYIDNSQGMKHVYPYEGSMRLRIYEDGTGYAGIRLRINNEGLHNVTVNATCESGSVTAYMFPAETAYTKYSECVELSSYMTEDNKLGVAADTTSPITASFSVAEAGEYILVLTGSKNIFLSSLEMAPVNAAAYADGVACGSLQEALGKATESVLLCENTSVENLTLNTGVTLDLNGYMLYATSVDADVPGANIVDNSDGNGLIRGDITFNMNNDQLPLYDIEADGYRLFNVDVDSVATTGSGNTSKYWFKVNFSNNAAFDLIGATTELRIKALMAGTYKTGHELEGQAFSGEAVADAAFTNTWAANNDAYIIVSSVGSSGINEFTLNPAVSANGVVISGDALSKG